MTDDDGIAEKTRPKPAALNLDPAGGKPPRLTGKASRRLGGAGLVLAALVPGALWLGGGWTAGQAFALSACLGLAGAIVFHIADHVADFLGR